MRITLIYVPYHLGRERTGTGLGPVRFTEGGADRILREAGHEVKVEVIERPGPFNHEIGATIGLNARLAEVVRNVVKDTRFPFILSGDCNSSLGTLGGIGSPEVGIIWFDAHGDFNTPETTHSGFFDGMALAATTGKCWQQLCKRIPNFHAVPESSVLLVGARDLDDKEQKLLNRSGIMILHAHEVKQRGIAESLEPALNTLHHRVKEVYLHVDMDVLDPQEALANAFQPPGGFSLTDLEQAIRMVADHFVIRAAAISAYDPACDEEQKSLKAGLRLIRTIVEATAQQRIEA